MSDDDIRALYHKHNLAEAGLVVSDLKLIVVEVEAAERERCANLVPTNWCDPLLTGGGKVIADKTDCPSIEALLQALAARIRRA